MSKFFLSFSVAFMQAVFAEMVFIPPDASGLENFSTIAAFDRAVLFWLKKFEAPLNFSFYLSISFPF